MVRAAIVALVVTLGAGACSPAQAPMARKVGKVLALGGVIGLVIGSAATHVTGDGTRPILVGFSLASTVGIGMYAAGEFSVSGYGEADETIPERNQRWARILTERAHGYARDGRCHRVRHIEGRVRAYDRVLHEGVFMRDPAIQKCLTNDAAPVQPVEELALPGTAR